MPDVITRYINKIKEMWKALDKSQKTRMIMSAVIVIGSVALAVFFVVRPNYEKIISGTASEIGAMSTILTSSSIEHKLDNNNTSILVKAKDRDNAKIALAQSGYLSAGTKFSDALGMITFSTTESDKKKIFKEYYESKIAEQLKKMDTISDAAVNLSIPDKSVFIGDDDADKPTASVVITPKSTLTDSQIDGIAKLVASSIERLNPNDVTVIDNTGVELTVSGDTGLSGLSTRQMQIQAQKKKELEKQVTTLLADVTDNVRVVANIVCDFDQETIKSVDYTSPVDGSDAGLIRSAQSIKENLQNIDSSAVPGTDANQGTGASVSTGNGGTYKKEETTTNYEMNQKETQVVKGLGNIDPIKSSITVSLLYGNKFIEVPTDETIENVTKMVNTATGINSERITVAPLKLLPVEPVKATINWLLLLEKGAPYIAAILIILILVFFVLGMKKSIGEAGSYTPSISNKVSSIDYSIGGSEDGAIKELDNNSEVKRQIGTFIEKQPDIAAGMLRNWIYENEKNPQ